MNSIILLSGPVGAGKSTVAPLLVDLLPGPVAYIEGDRFWSFFAKGAETNGRVKNFKVLMASMVAAALPFAIGGNDVVVDFSIPPWYLPNVLKIAQRREIPVDYVVLKPGEDVCAARAAARANWAVDDYERFHHLYESFDEYRGSCVQNDTIAPTAAAAHIFNGLNQGIYRLNPNIQ